MTQVCWWVIPAITETFPWEIREAETFPTYHMYYLSMRKCNLPYDLVYVAQKSIGKDHPLPIHLIEFRSGPTDSQSSNYSLQCTEYNGITQSREMIGLKNMEASELWQNFSPKKQKDFLLDAGNFFLLALHTRTHAHEHTSNREIHVSHYKL